MSAQRHPIQYNDMTSSNSPGDNDAPLQNSSENPFIKFRNAVDYHIGSVLQGITRLPTILSRALNSGNGRWAKLIDNSQLSQGHSWWTSPQTDSSENTSDEEINVPVKKFNMQSVGANGVSEPSNHNGDYDLFSAFIDERNQRLPPTIR